MAATVHLAKCNICKADFALRVTLTRHIKTDQDISIQSKPSNFFNRKIIVSVRILDSGAGP